MTAQRKSYLFITNMITDWIENYSFQEKKNIQDRAGDCLI